MHLPEPFQGFELCKPTSLDKAFEVFCAYEGKDPCVRGTGFHEEET